MVATKVYVKLRENEGNYYSHISANGALGTWPGDPFVTLLYIAGFPLMTKTNYKEMDAAIHMQILLCGFKLPVKLEL